VTMSPSKYRKKPIVVEAMQYTVESRNDIIKWIGSGVQATAIDDDGAEYDLLNLRIHTLEGVMRCDVGDYVIKGVKGEFYPCKPDIFERTYELVE
jgi:hypothetical protein